MLLHLPTLYAAHAGVALALAALLVVFWLAHRQIAGIGLWTLGTSFMGLGTLATALRAFLPEIVGVVAGTTTIFLGMATLWAGIRAFNGRPVPFRLLAVAAALFFALVGAITFGIDDYPLRAMVVSAILSGVNLLSAHELCRHGDRRLRQTRRTAAILFTLIGAILAFRVGWLAILGPLPSAPADGPSGVVILISILCNVLAVFALLMMAAQRLQQLLGAAAERALGESRAKSEFLALMSHELRTPLNAILGFSEVQQKEMFGPLQPRYRAYAEHIHQSGAHLLELITTILDFSKADAGKIELDRQFVDVPALFGDLQMLVADTAARRRVVLTIAVPARAPLCYADRRALKQVLLNLLSNAIKFTPEGGAVSLHVRLVADGGLVFEVRDTGIGIDPKEIPRLLKPFEQARSSYIKTEAGTGLGLPIAEKLVTLHGGRLEIASEPGAGTVVTVSIPGGPSHALAEAAD